MPDSHTDDRQAVNPDDHKRGFTQVADPELRADLEANYPNGEGGSASGRGRRWWLIPVALGVGAIAGADRPRTGGHCPGPGGRRSTTARRRQCPH
jgi:hypothetical protein